VGVNALLKILISSILAQAAPYELVESLKYLPMVKTLLVYGIVPVAENEPT
jgi:hypothetical protein